ncbi:aspartic proteinase CDR1-like [Lotus japonicus]|uniref:aspartic proteinase CDR1-like n=1 Tax=Lotus japonicus TaxID=34305 RepID=UPI002583074F|nr:aspartic proteinase CDR1-like [Lotus japonicus]
MTPCSVLTLLLCLYCITSHAHSLNNGFSVELVHRDSLKSPLHRPSESQFQKVANSMRRSIGRAAKRFNKANYAPINIPESSVSPDSVGEYIMSYSIGTPLVKVFGDFDTGSEVVWLQCNPCEKCYNQTTSPIFDPSKSTTYTSIPCASELCKSFSDTYCEKTTCEYNITYADGTYTKGDIGVDTLTLDSTNGSLISFPRTVIGCGHNNAGFEKETSGVVGIGVGPVSLISQLGSSIHGFSYCLVPIFSNSNVSSKLNFGDDVVISGNGSVNVPIVPGSDKIFYYFNLEAFSVGDKRVEFGNSSSGGDEGNIIIDTGTVLTLLPPDDYSRLESAVADAVKLERVQDPNKVLSLCYKATLKQLEFVKVTAHFKGADLQLNSLNTFVEVSDGINCLAFTASDIGATFGNLAQQNFLIGYDLQKKIVTFKPTDCTKE